MRLLSRVGALSDPEDIPGLVNLLYYVMMMIQLKSNFVDYLKVHGGNINKTTSYELNKHMYGFYVDSQHLFSALERWVILYLQYLLLHYFFHPNIMAAILIENEHASFIRDDKEWFG